MFAFSMRKFFWGLIVVAAGALLWASNLGYIALSLQFRRDWPLILVCVGLMSIWEALFGRHWWGHKFASSRGEKRDRVEKVLEDLEKGNINAEEAAKRMGGE